MIVPAIHKIWSNYFPKNVSERIEEDYWACLHIAYRIAGVKGIKRADVVKKEFEMELLRSWVRIVQYVNDSSWSKFKLSTISFEFENIKNEMSHGKQGQERKENRRDNANRSTASTDSWWPDFSGL